MQPETRYAKSGDLHIAYQVLGDGPLDVVVCPGWVSHLEYAWAYPPQVYFMQRLASFSRLINFDKRGTGLSDRVAERALPTLEERIDDVRAVMDAVGSERAALFGSSEGGPCPSFRRHLSRANDAPDSVRVLPNADVGAGLSVGPDRRGTAAVPRVHRARLG